MVAQGVSLGDQLSRLMTSKTNVWYVFLSKKNQKRYFIRGHKIRTFSNARFVLFHSSWNHHLLFVCPNEICLWWFLVTWSLAWSDLNVPKQAFPIASLILGNCFFDSTAPKSKQVCSLTISSPLPVNIYLFIFLKRDKVSTTAGRQNIGIGQYRCYVIKTDDVHTGLYFYG